MSYLPNENRETDSNPDAPGLRRIPMKAPMEKGRLILEHLRTG